MLFPNLSNSTWLLALLCQPVYNLKFRKFRMLINIYPKGTMYMMTVGPSWMWHSQLTSTFILPCSWRILIASHLSRASPEQRKLPKNLINMSICLILRYAGEANFQCEIQGDNWVMLALGCTIHFPMLNIDHRLHRIWARKKVNATFKTIKLVIFFGEMYTGWPTLLVKISHWPRFEIFRPPAWAVGSYSSSQNCRN